MAFRKGMSNIIMPPRLDDFLLTYLKKKFVHNSTTAAASDEIDGGRRK